MTGKPRNERIPPQPRDTVGDQYARGQLSGGVRGALVWVNCTLLGAGVIAEIDPDEADGFALSLVLWARLARANRARPVG